MAKPIYIILSATPSSPVKSLDEQHTFSADYTVNVGIQDDPFGFSKGDGCTITWDKSMPGDQAEQYIQGQIFNWMNQKYNS